MVFDIMDMDCLAACGRCFALLYPELNYTHRCIPLEFTVTVGSSNENIAVDLTLAAHAMLNECENCSHAHNYSGLIDNSFNYETTVHDDDYIYQLIIKYVDHHLNKHREITMHQCKHCGILYLLALAARCHETSCVFQPAKH